MSLGFTSYHRRPGTASAHGQFTALVHVGFGTGLVDSYLVSAILSRTAERSAADSVVMHLAATYVVGDTMPTLVPVEYGGQHAVFVVGPRPWLLLWRESAVRLIPVNLTDVLSAATLLDIPRVGPGLGARAFIIWIMFLTRRVRAVTVSRYGIQIASIDGIDRIHVEAVPIYETPLRVAYMESTGSVGVLRISGRLELTVDSVVALLAERSLTAEQETRCSIRLFSLSNPASQVCLSAFFVRLELICVDFDSSGSGNLPYRHFMCYIERPSESPRCG